MILRGGLVVTVDSEGRILDGGDVRITEDRITAVSEEPLEPDAGEEVLDVSATVVMPGLVNTHTHLFQTLLRAVYDHLPLPEYLAYIYRVRPGP